MTIETIPTSGDVRVPIRRALISVYDKTGLEDLARELAKAGVEIFSTGSTAKKIAEAGVAVTPVEELTGFPECLEGRVKTLHPRVHAGILADRRKETHVAQLEELGITPFDLVVCNLYPFGETVASGANFDECVEQIDIGGPTMVRASAKNHASVTVLVSPEQYEMVPEALAEGGFTANQRFGCATQAFMHTADYDRAVSEWMVARLLERMDEDDLAEIMADDDEFAASEGGSCGCGCSHAHGGETELELEEYEEEGDLPFEVATGYELLETLRYGENPHQQAAVYGLVDSDLAEEEELEDIYEYEDEEIDRQGDDNHPPLPGIANARQLHGKPMSYNNYTDADAALRAAYDHDEPCVAVIKHANPCGIAVAADVATAHRKAHACDPVSAFGGVIAVNRPVTVELAKQIVPIFTEVVIAPAYEDGAVEVLSAKKNLRVLQVTPPVRGGLEFKQISGGLLVQESDCFQAEDADPANWQLAAGPAVDEATLADLAFAWRCVRAAKSNAVLLAKDGACVGVGMGQVNRVDSCKLAIERANTLGGRQTGDAAGIDSAGGANAAELLGEATAPRRSEGSVCASDAFFPFADGPQLLIDAGVKAIVQPGGSIRDEETLKVCAEAGVSVYLTGTRHFFH